MSDQVSLIALVPLKATPFVTTEQLTELAFSIWKMLHWLKLPLTHSYSHALLVNQITEYYLIKLASTTVGIIGHFEFPHTKEIVGLSWSGIIPTHQKNG